MFICRGQVMNAEMMSNVVDIELIQDGIKYSLKVSLTQSTIFFHLLSFFVSKSALKSQVKRFCSANEKVFIRSRGTQDD